VNTGRVEVVSNAALMKGWFLMKESYAAMECRGTWFIRMETGLVGALIDLDGYVLLKVLHVNQCFKDAVTLKKEMYAPLF